ncbi:Helicase-like (plasmid) [Calothrix sp. PCC 7716]|nr:Helicase-like [Calothrix sp. PCC 7716]
MPATTPAEVRSRLIDALQLDLVGPTPDDVEHAHEVLPQAPSMWYLTGFLVPYEASATQRSDDAGNEEINQLGRGAAGDDESTPEAASARKAFFPSSMGLSFLVSQEVKSLNVIVRWGDYKPIAEKRDEEQAETSMQLRNTGRWQRIPQYQQLTIPIDISLIENNKISKYEVSGSNGLQLILTNRSVGTTSGLPAGTCSIALFLVNYRSPAEDKVRDIAYTFQTELIVESDESFVPRPNPRGQSGDDWDEKVADLQYRDAFEYVVGHNVSAIAHLNPDNSCKKVCTAWMPTADVEKVVATNVQDVELRMEVIAGASDAATTRNMLQGIVTSYINWIADQKSKIPTDSAYRERVATDLLDRAVIANQRIDIGLRALDDPLVLEAFQIANRVIATALRQRSTHDNDKSPDEADSPRWRPFQLAFLLMNIAGIADPTHPDRELVDLLFFPTGGGKTEAYLGLAAFTLVLRRLQSPGIDSAGLSVLMRYTLRLLTLDQLGRAATLICALELERENNPDKLGQHPFEIGLWVGMTATPNKMGKKNDNDQNSARARTIAFNNDTKGKPSPIPLENCPWCGEKFTGNSFQLLPNSDQPLGLNIVCTNRKTQNGKPKCMFRSNRPLPVIAVDEPIYRRLPCFLIATVDKFANLPWIGQTAALFGQVTHYDADGFYGSADTRIQGRLLPNGKLLPPDLIIQDELHLISGPLGTMVGLYETAIDSLSSRTLDDKTIRPKVVASTATVRKATRQIRGLFGRHQVDVFPPPGPDRRDSFFARTAPIHESNPRTYLGIAAQGRSLKVVLLRVYLALLSAAQKDWEAAGGAKNTDNPADAYMTLLGYFNSLRELGGSRRIVEDEVNARLNSYGLRMREGETSGSFTNRKIQDEPCELTSRVSTNKVAETKRRLQLPFENKERLDVVLATNMISVGLDIVRLGLMVVLGQPKTAAEYIQATSRVGRDEKKPGLVVTLLNIHRPRDRSHYERFQTWHTSFYRAVEATSVTPFSPRAVDRGIAGITVALARLGNRNMTAPMSAAEIEKHRHNLNVVADIIAQRAEVHDEELSRTEADDLRIKIRGRVNDILDAWESIAKEKGLLQYQQEVGSAPPLLYDFLDPELKNQKPIAQKFKAQRSLRDVEPVVHLWATNLDTNKDEEED